MSVLSNYKQDKNGFYLLDKDAIRLGKPLYYHKGITPIMIGDDKFYFKRASLYGKKTAKALHKKGIANNNTIAGADFFMLSEVYYSKLAKRFGINSVDYSLVSIDGKRGVISNDFAAMQDGKSGDLSEILGITTSYCRDDLRFLHKSGFFESCDERVLTSFEVLSMFDFATFQFDRNNGNVAIAKDGSNQFNKVIGLDYANNGVAFHIARPEDKFLFGLDKKYRTTMGIDKTDSSVEKYLYDITHSQYIRPETIKYFLDTLDDSLVNNKVFTEIHNEIAEEYDIGKDKAFSLFETRLRTAMEINGEKLERAFNEREM